ncbi:mcm3 (nucleomorph) [Hemiselmis andersenii]|uniref:Mcm3 n=2 Tax=Hemiselmis andersenii TaxID=464988 RepID=A9BLC1_HEMAN|nr:mcm3 [Hemiselmis andersenii]ABW98304.1 mcm3 [Hemiselmis andersenii]
MEKIKSNRLVLFFKNRFSEFFKKANLFGKIFKSSSDVFRVPVSIDKLWNFDPFLAKNLLENPVFCFPIMTNSLNFAFKNFNSKKNEKKMILIPDLKGPFGKRTCLIRSLRAHFLGEIVCIRGIVVKRGERKIKIKRSVHYSNKSAKFFVKENNEFDEDLTFDLIDEGEGNILDLEYGLSKFINWQSILVEDFPDQNSSSKNPKTIIVVLENDLVDSCKIGDQIELCGIYKPLLQQISSLNFHFFPTIISALSLKNRFNSEEKISNNFDIYMMKNFSSLANSFEKLSSLVSPKIFGKTLIKKGIILFLVAGTNIQKKINFCSDQINILLIGRDSFVKSQFFYFIHKIFPNLVVGKETLFEENFSKQISYPFEEKRKLKNESSPNLDKKILCIEDLEQTSETQKNSIKEIMEQQTVTLQQNNLSFSLNSRSNVFATANISENFFDSLENLEFHLETTNSILHRFDLTFFLFDDLSFEEDKEIATLFLETQKNLLFNKPPKNITDDDNSNFSVKKKKKKKEKNKINLKKEKLSYHFLKIFLNFVRNNIRPEISNEADDLFFFFYKEIKLFKFINLTPNIKKFESFIKLAISLAKCQLRSVVLRKDVRKIGDFFKELSENEKKIKKTFFHKEKMLNSKKKYPKHTKNFDYSKKIFKDKVHKKVFWEICSEKNLVLKFFFKDVKNIFLNFFQAKKILKSRKICFLFEKTISIWLKKNFCFVFKKKIIKI